MGWMILHDICLAVFELILQWEVPSLINFESVSFLSTSDTMGLPDRTAVVGSSSREPSNKICLGGYAGFVLQD